MWGLYCCVNLDSFSHHRIISSSRLFPVNEFEIFVRRNREKSKDGDNSAVAPDTEWIASRKVGHDMSWENLYDLFNLTLISHYFKYESTVATLLGRPNSDHFQKAKLQILIFKVSKFYHNCFCRCQWVQEGQRCCYSLTWGVVPLSSQTFST